MADFIKLGAASLLAGVAISSADASSLLAASPAAVTPTKSASVAGSGFGASEAIDVYFDTTDTALSVSNSAGSFGAPITIPATATPGKHYVTAIGRKSGDAAQIAITVTTPWTEHGFGTAHLGWNPYENVLSTSNVSSIGTFWRKNIGAESGTPAVFNGSVYVGTSSGVSALSTASGTVIWNKTLNETVYGSPALNSTGTTLYFGTASGNFYALNPATGATLWKYALGTSTLIYASPVYANGMVYFGAINGTFYALNATTGALLWSYTTGNAIDGSPALDGGNVYFGSHDNKVYALNVTTGALVWRYTTGGVVESSPAIANGVLYIGSDDSKIYALGTSVATAGQLIWSYTTGDYVSADPVVANGMIFVGSEDGKFYALNARTGSLSWSLTTGGSPRSAAVANGVVYFTSEEDDTAYAVAASYGGVLASGSTGASGFFGGPAVSDGKVYLSTYAGEVYAFAANGGADPAPSAVRQGPRLDSLHPDLSLVAVR